MRSHTFEKWRGASEALQGLGRSHLIALLFCLLVLVYGCDYITGPLIPFTIFYVILTWIAGSLLSGHWAYAFAILSTLATTSIDLQAVDQVTLVGTAWKAMVNAAIFLVAADLSIGWTQLHKDLQDEASSDPLTGAFNRRAFFERINEELSRSMRKKLPLSLAFIDLDNFKNINDSCGHEKGDEVLKAVASTLALHLRTGDALGRLGGDEFAILLHETDHEQVKPVMTRLVNALKSSASLSNTGISFSIGVVTSNTGKSTSVDELLAIADEAMYEVKRSTKNAVGFTVVDATTPGHPPQAAGLPPGGGLRP